MELLLSDCLNSCVRADLEWTPLRLAVAVAQEVEFWRQGVFTWKEWKAGCLRASREVMAAWGPKIHWQSWLGLLQTLDLLCSYWTGTPTFVDLRTRKRLSVRQRRMRLDWPPPPPRSGGRALAAICSPE